MCSKQFEFHWLLGRIGKFSPKQHPVLPSGQVQERGASPAWPVCSLGASKSAVNRLGHLDWVIMRHVLFVFAWETPPCFTHCPKPRSHTSDPSTKDLAFLTIYWGTPLPLSSQGESFLVASFHWTMTLWPFLLPMGSTTRKAWGGWPLGCINHHTNMMGCSQAWQDGEDPVHVSAPEPTCPVLPQALSHLCCPRALSWSHYFRFFHCSRFTISNNSSSEVSQGIDTCSSRHCPAGRNTELGVAPI